MNDNDSRPIINDKNESCISNDSFPTIIYPTLIINDKNKSCISDDLLNTNIDYVTNSELSLDDNNYSYYLF